LIEAVIFDLDGTLIYLPIDYKRLFQRFSEIMKTSDIHPLTEKILELDKETRERIFEVWSNAELEAMTDITVNKDGMALYRKFLEKPKALVTMQGEMLVKNVLKRLDLSFNFVITRERCLDRVQQLKMAARKLRVSFSNLLFIGNTENDFLSAKKVGCQFLRVGK
jgi:HAD superfamily hydrolase (TIGR01549 family)